jgi:hypothetical protein
MSTRLRLVPDRIESQIAGRMVGDARTALYRHYCDLGLLLYVGISCNPLGRLANHKASPLSISPHVRKRNWRSAKRSRVKIRFTTSATVPRRKSKSRTVRKQRDERVSMVALKTRADTIG